MKPHPLPLRRACSRGRCLSTALLLSLSLLGVPREAAASFTGMPSGGRAGSGRLPLLSSAEAWKCLPPAEKGAGAPLPVWARALAPTLPHTTAAMLELDFRQRARSPLDARLRAKMRWVAADANGCAVGRAAATADLLSAGGKLADLRLLARVSAWKDLPEAERAALTFARKLSVSAADVSDREVARLVRLYGERRLVAMVLLVAHASFEDRLHLALGLPAEERPLPPLEVCFRKPGLGARLAAPRPKLPAAPARVSPPARPDHQWAALDIDFLGKALEKQRSRRPRIALPRAREGVIYWGEVCRTYQPELAAAWSACMRTFGAEAGQDAVFETSVFWVVSRAQRSFY